jgi:hypothetical protein
MRLLRNFCGISRNDIKNDVIFYEYGLHIHELRLVHIRGLAGEDVIIHLESRCNEEDAPRSARLKGKKGRKINIK